MGLAEDSLLDLLDVQLWDLQMTVSDTWLGIRVTVGALLYSM